MITALLLTSLLTLVAGGTLCAFLGGRSRLSNRLGATMSVLGAIPAMVGAGYVLWSGRPASFNASWNVPFGSFHIALDSLSSFFVVAIAVICGLSALYGVGYMASHIGRKNLGVSWFFYNILFASMLLVVMARNGMLFLVAWEMMSLSSFFLVMFDHEQEDVRKAGFVYLVAMHLGTAFLLAMFAILGHGDLSMNFDQFAVPSGSAVAGVLFLLALVGFGVKAGMLPMHVWLPEAHPAAPSHVSAVMSGVMIKTGIYGLLRTLTFLGNPPEWWGWTLIVIGAASGIVGVLFALAQHDLKRLLAYSSVENIGIICLGLGLWLLGVSVGNTTLATLGLLGGLLHVWNHAIFKSLLFLGAGAIAHATGTRDIEQLGGLLKRMRGTGLAFLIGSAAICGLPPLNGFVSEFLIYVGALKGVAALNTTTSVALAGLAAVTSLALIGGLAMACFGKAFGVIFLGVPRSECVANAHEATFTMRAVMMTLAGLCIAIGMLGPLAIQAAWQPARQLLAKSAPVGWIATEATMGLLWRISLAGIALALLVLIFWGLRRWLLAGRTVTKAGTWDCGYAAPNARMQYTASSFAWPIVDMFRWLLRPRLRRHLPSDLFPKHAEFESHSEDIFRRYVYDPLFEALAFVAGKLRWLQQGRNQLYVLYIVLTLLALLLWKLG